MFTKQLLYINGGAERDGAEGPRLGMRADSLV